MKMRKVSQRSIATTPNTMLMIRATKATTPMEPHFMVLTISGGTCSDVVLREKRCAK